MTLKMYHIEKKIMGRYEKRMKEGESFLADSTGRQPRKYFQREDPKYQAVVREEN